MKWVNYVWNPFVNSHRQTASGMLKIIFSFTSLPIIHIRYLLFKFALNFKQDRSWRKNTIESRPWIRSMLTHPHRSVDLASHKKPLHKLKPALELASFNWFCLIDSCAWWKLLQTCRINRVSLQATNVKWLLTATTGTEMRFAIQSRPFTTTRRTTNMVRKHIAAHFHAC